MGRGPILKIGFTKLKNSDLIADTNTIIECMTNNELYDDAGTKLTNVKNCLSSFVKSKAKKGRVLNYKEVKRENRISLLTALQTLGKYIIKKYPDNVANWRTTGYKIQLFAGGIQKPLPPESLKAMDGREGKTTLIKYEKAKYATSYLGRHWKEKEKAPENPTASTLNLKLIFNNIKPGVVYNYQVCSVGTKGKSRWSNIIKWALRPEL